ncbi:MAG: hypothetical protein AAF384_12605 [Pseudomonadota bacterium]
MQHKASEAPTQSPRLKNAVCPFCSLLCDDLVLTPNADGSFKTAAGACHNASKAYLRAPSAPAPTLNGNPATFDDAFAALAKLIKRSSRPHFGGLATDVNGMRQIIRCAERSNASLDHAHGEIMAATTELLQSRGYYATTLSEVRNRCDLALIFDVDFAARYTNFLKRCTRPKQSLSGPIAKRRETLFIGSNERSPFDGGDKKELSIDVRRGEIDDFALLLLGALRRKTGTGALAKKAQEVVAKIRDAAYVTLVWAPGQVSESPLALGWTLADVVHEINATGRGALLTLGGDDGGQTAQNVSAWTTGYPNRIAFNRGSIDYAPKLNATRRLLEHQAIDALVWVDSFGRGLKIPPGNVPTVVIGRQKPHRPHDIYIPVGVPTIDHDADLVRTDSSVTLRGRALRDSELPSVAKVFSEVMARL